MKVEQARFTIRLDMGYGSRFRGLISYKNRVPISQVEKTMRTGMVGMRQYQELNLDISDLRCFIACVETEREAPLCETQVQWRYLAWIHKDGSCPCVDGMGNHVSG